MTIDKENVLAWGHLDPDGGRICAGVAVLYDFVGKGLGSAMVEKLVDVARKNLAPCIWRLI